MEDSPAKIVNGDIVRIYKDKKHYQYMFTRKYRQELFEKCKNNPLIDLSGYENK